MKITIALNAPKLEAALSQLLNLGALMPTLNEVVTQLQNVMPVLEKIQSETSGLQVEIASLKDIIAAMGNSAPPELVDVANRISAKVASIDQLVPDGA